MHSAECSQTWKLLWAKTDDCDSSRWHSLACHSLDVGHVAQALLTSPRGEIWSELLAERTGWPASSMPELCGCLAALHDLGKANPVFQRRWDPGWQRLQAAGYEHIPTREQRHDAESLVVLGTWLRGRVAPADTGAVASAVASHHGVWHSLIDVERQSIVSMAESTEAWRAKWINSRVELADWLEQQFLPYGWPTAVRWPHRWPAAMLLNGLIILADWLGSDTASFPLACDWGPDEYSAASSQRAQAAVANRRLSDHPAAQPDAELESLFAWPARPIQRALGAAALPAPRAPFLAIVEAPTGEGKTEAALLLARRTAGSFYFALPTTATSDQMYDRIREWLGDGAQVNLVHGLSQLRSEEHGCAPQWSGDRADEAAEAIAVDAWFAPRKRALLSPQGVGTIDQALFGALLVKHVSLRLLGLAGRVLVVDEVHAYDLYMCDLLKRLLAWLAALDTSVILLSATLPSGRRRELVTAFGASVGSDAPDQEYPLITLAAAGSDAEYLTPPADSARHRTVTLRRCSSDNTEDVGNELLALLATSGGVAAWICNTVSTAQQTYSLLKKLAGDRSIAIDLFHAQYPLGEREQRAQRCVLHCGPDSEKQSPRPARVVVATQVIEQSLDLDFDWLVSELAPVDLVLQRLGRLWRHERIRPGNCPAPKAWLLIPGSGAEGPAWGGSGKVYGAWLLLKTLLILQGHDHVAVPEDVRSWVESVYDDRLPSSDEIAESALQLCWFEKALACQQKDDALQEQAAKLFLLGAPNASASFWQSGLAMIHDDGEAERRGGWGLSTRFGRPSVRCIPVCRGDVFFDRLAAGGKLPLDQQRRLLRRSLSISRSEVVRAAVAQHWQPDARWAKSGPLAAYVALPLSDDGTCKLGRGRRLRLDAELGVVVEGGDVTE